MTGKGKQNKIGQKHAKCNFKRQESPKNTISPVQCLALTVCRVEVRDSASPCINFSVSVGVRQ